MGFGITRTVRASTGREPVGDASRICAAPLRAHGASTQQLAQNEESGLLGGEAGSGGGLGALTALGGTFSAASHKTSTLRSPAFASSMIVLAIISSLRSPRRLMAARAVSNAMPTRRAVSGSKVWPFRKGLMGTRASPSRQAEPKARQFHFKRCETKKRIKLPSRPGTESMFWYFASSMRREP